MMHDLIQPGCAASPRRRSRKPLRENASGAQFTVIAEASDEELQLHGAATQREIGQSSRVTAMHPVATATAAGTVHPRR